ncbi:MAG: UDP-N-acetylmuramoyl-L-alanyl-D-glutamate--2,6-diaminopimelate ligase [Bacteroidota bacterium]
MKLKNILEQVPVISREGSEEIEIVSVAFDSRKVEEGSLFVAEKGTQVDGHEFIDKAIAQGAKAVICEELPVQKHEGVTYLQVENSRRELAHIAANFYGNPARKLIMVGVTGTNGKSTSVTLLHELFQSLGTTSGLVSTICNKIGNEVMPSTHTTPDPLQLHKLFADMLEAGCEYCFMEVSSHSLVQHRVTGIPFKLAMFSNLTHDHLDYHGSFREYLRAKKLLFDHLGKNAIALVNLDDRNGKVMVQNTVATVRTFARKRMADYHTRLIENTFEGLLLEIGGQEVWFRMRGSFNADNLLMVFAAAVELGEVPQEVLQKLSLIGGVAGRFEVFQAENRPLTAIVDYAHTPDALKNVLSTILDINQTRGKVITIVGCGGNRDREKRPKMARIAAEMSDRVILTSDNPRNEDPMSILQEMQTGIPAERRNRVLTIEDRKEAIRTGIALASDFDIVLVAGKGHEPYQEIQGVRHPFDDREVVKDCLREP